jgi:hypothetical protein
MALNISLPKAIKNPSGTANYTIITSQIGIWEEFRECLCNIRAKLRADAGHGFVILPLSYLYQLSTEAVQTVAGEEHEARIRDRREMGQAFYQSGKQRASAGMSSRRVLSQGEPQAARWFSLSGRLRGALCLVQPLRFWVSRLWSIAAYSALSIPDMSKWLG